MHLAFCTIAVSTLALIISSTLAPAAEVRVLSIGSTQVAAKAIAADFEKQTHNQVLTYTDPPRVRLSWASSTSPKSRRASPFIRPTATAIRPTATATDIRLTATAIRRTTATEIGLITASTAHAISGCDVGEPCLTCFSKRLAG